MLKEEQQPLLREKNENVVDHERIRYASYFLTFCTYLAFGIFSELYTDVFDDIIDPNDYAKASFWSTIAYANYALFSFFLCPILATMSDSIGRRPILLLASLNDCITYTAFGFITSNWVFTIVNGIQGGFDASTSVNYALLADTISDDSHFENELSTLITIRWSFATLGALLGIWLGDLLYLITGSLEWSMASAGFVMLPAVVTTYAFLGETRVVDPKPLACSNACDACLSQITSLEIIYTKRRLFWLAVVNFLNQFAISGLADIYLYWGEWRFGWDTTLQAISLSLFCVAIPSALVLSHSIGPSIGFAQAISFLLMVTGAGCIGCALAQSTAGVFLALFFVGIGAGSQPAIFSQMSLEVDVAEQGRLQGSNYAIMTVAWFTGPYFYWWLYDLNLTDDGNNSDAGLWWCSSVIFILTGVLMLYAGNHGPSSGDST